MSDGYLDDVAPPEKEKEESSEQSLHWLDKLLQDKPPKEEKKEGDYLLDDTLDR